MSRYRRFSPDEAGALADRLGMEFAEGDAESVAEYSDVDVYDELEAVPIHELRSRTGGDVYETPPYRSTPDEDPYNAWITRFDSSRPDTNGLLSGVDIGVKDNLAVRGVELTNASHGFEGVVPDEHATVVERLLDAGARLRGKTNLDEMAMGPTSESSAFGPSLNPANPDHVAGGSSGGSGAAVAAGDVALALGSDTGGSIRIPASYCGIVGLKPTHGRVPKRGFLTQAESLEEVGPMAEDVETAARAMEVIADSPSNESREQFSTDLGIDLSEVTLGVIDHYLNDFATDEVRETVQAALDRFASLGATIETVEIPELAHTNAAWWGIGPVEFAMAYLSNDIGLGQRRPGIESLADGFDRVGGATSDRIGTVPKEMILLGAHLLFDQGGYHYVRGKNLREALTTAVDETFSEYDALVTPSTPTTALAVGAFGTEEMPSPNGSLAPANVTGHPALSLPCGESNGLPVGLQLIGSWYEDEKLFDVAYEFEQSI
ncbi:MAG TPA: amidase family protein [Halococcus sp.]|nr:amidase family protein [Halococcus sp.]